MDAAHQEPGPADRPFRLRAVTGDRPRVPGELAGQFDTTVAFADFCAFLTSGRASGRAEQLVRLAETLYDETIGDLNRVRSEQ
jgi:hypothetical protein